MDRRQSGQAGRAEQAEQAEQAGEMMNSQQPAITEVSVIIPTYNEEMYITGVLQSLVDQLFRGHIEIIIVDGASTDRTVAIIGKIRERLPLNRSIVLLSNPKRHIPVSLNLACQQASSELLIRLDGHTFAPANYITEVIRMLEAEGGNQAVCGGRIQIEPGLPTTMAKAITVAVSHPVGIGNALYRTSNGTDQRCVEVDTVPFASFTKQLWTELGGFDEFLLYDEDSDFNFRAKQLGYKVLLNPGIVFTYFSRPTIELLGKQYYRYGYWVSKFLVKHKRVPTLRRLAPSAFLAAVVFLGFIHVGLWLFMLLAYTAVIAAVSFHEGVIKRKSPWLWLRLIPVFPVLHLSYGVGNVMGLVTSMGLPFHGRSFMSYK
ncbi:glycosyltransferase family 2 protein [Paenibacillus agricola]|uniref:Glycosyltransferase family 2 protein n=1 Tax=Paenibacillus agricola TaxID=2716264 RepID=A0ABX0J1S5_9BACL|nr:glycosyltransferase family 2 protein [Paenibacillus agricola]NHN29386.1 glycosyltransferase family 2 protein [Paenibacillus agricola]